jgi:hypothetical protein
VWDSHARFFCLTLSPFTCVRWTLPVWDSHVRFFCLTLSIMWDQLYPCETAMWDFSSHVRFFCLTLSLMWDQLYPCEPAMWDFSASHCCNIISDLDCYRSSLSFDMVYWFMSFEELQELVFWTFNCIGWRYSSEILYVDKYLG